MRIVSGIYGGRRLMTPKGKDIRPTSDKIRGALFNALGSLDALDNARVLDGFCGTGALGLEALSRGAEHCLFIDKSPESLSLTKENAKGLGADGRCAFKRGDTSKLPSNNEAPYDLIFLDPPYNKDYITQSLTALRTGKWLSASAILICESEKHWSYTGQDFDVKSEKIYGETKITILGSQERPNKAEPAE